MLNKQRISRQKKNTEHYRVADKHQVVHWTNGLQEGSGYLELKDDIFSLGDRTKEIQVRI